MKYHGEQRHDVINGKTNKIDLPNNQFWKDQIVNSDFVYVSVNLEKVYNKYHIVSVEYLTSEIVVYLSDIVRQNKSGVF